ncbi:MAG: hypothetical protein IPF72_18725 [Chitinophagaceae bacterium]|nr:hypothetical protein [Chitinophagaceae bacterium]
MKRSYDGDVGRQSQGRHITGYSISLSDMVDSANSIKLAAILEKNFSVRFLIKLKSSYCIVLLDKLPVLITLAGQPLGYTIKAYDGSTVNGAVMKAADGKTKNERV